MKTFIAILLLIPTAVGANWIFNTGHGLGGPDKYCSDPTYDAAGKDPQPCVDDSMF